MFFYSISHPPRLFRPFVLHHANQPLELWDHMGKDGYLPTKAFPTLKVLVDTFHLSDNIPLISAQRNSYNNGSIKCQILECPLLFQHFFKQVESGVLSYHILD